MVGRAAPIPIAELRAVVAQVRALDRAAPTRASRPRAPALAVFLTILLISLRAATIPAFLPSSTDLEENRMRSLAKLGVVSSIAAITSAAAAQNAVQWRVQDGGNGHWYQLVIPPSRVNIDQALAGSHALGGDLVSISNAAENIFVFEIARQDPSRWQLVWPGATQIGGPWIGARFVSPKWVWTDGTAWTFTAWSANNPNYMDEEHAVLYMGYAGGPPTSEWNNIQPYYLNWGYVIEWSADCNNDGIVDYGQILSGELADANQNGIPDCCENGGSCNCPGDTNNDRRVDGIDLATVLARWGMPGAKFPSADCNDDGLIDGIDLAIVLGGWGVCQ